MSQDDVKGDQLPFKLQRPIVSSHQSDWQLANYKTSSQPAAAALSLFAVCRGRAGPWTGAGAGARARLFVVGRRGWPGARLGTGLGARFGAGLGARFGTRLGTRLGAGFGTRLGAGFGPGGGPGDGLDPSWGPSLWGAAHRPGAAPGAVAAPGAALGARVASGAGARAGSRAGATLAVTVGRIEKEIKSLLIQMYKLLMLNMDFLAYMVQLLISNTDICCHGN